MFNWNASSFSIEFKSGFGLDSVTEFRYVTTITWENLTFVEFSGYKSSWKFQLGKD